MDSNSPVGLWDYFLMPHRIEGVLNHGILICLSSLLNEMVLMPLSALWSSIVFLLTLGYSGLTLVQKTNILRTLVLVVAVLFFNIQLDFSAVYHFIRAQSSLKLYFLFNMLEIFERQVRSWGNDMLHWAVNSLVRYETTESSSIFSVFGHWGCFVVYTIIHGYIHFWRVMLVTVAIASSDSFSMFMIILTNNFAELKSSVEKIYHLKSLYPVVSRDIVERIYLFVDVSLLLFRMATSPQKTKMPFVDVAYWVGVMIGIEILTDWVKLLCVSKRNKISPPVYTFYETIHHTDVINSVGDDIYPTVSWFHRIGIVSPSHLTARRISFVSTPLAALILSNAMLPNMVNADPSKLWSYRLLFLSAVFLLKVIIDWILIGWAKTRKNNDLGDEDLSGFRVP
jgi:hypothetical protein